LDFKILYSHTAEVSCLLGRYSGVIGK